MFIRFRRSLVVTVYRHDIEEGLDHATVKGFAAGQLVRVGEVSPAEGETCFEFVGMGYVELPDDAWEGVPLTVALDGMVGLN